MKAYTSVLNIMKINMGQITKKPPKRAQSDKKSSKKFRNVGHQPTREPFQRSNTGPFDSKMALNES